MDNPKRDLPRLDVRYWRLEPYMDLENNSFAGLIHDAFVDSLVKCMQVDESQVLHMLNYVQYDSQVELLPQLLTEENSVAMPIIIESGGQDIPQEFVGLVETGGLAWLYQADPPESNILLVGFGTVWPIMLLVLVLTGYAALIIWLAELSVKTNRQFDSSFLRGFCQSYWFAYISATTVGYGDKVPRSTAGKLVSLLWILCGLSLMSSFTAAMTTLINNLAMPPANEIPPLHNVEIGVLNSSIDQRLVIERGARPIGFADLESLVHALQNHKIDSIALDPNVYCTNAEKLHKGSLEFRLGITDATIVGYIFSVKNHSLLECMKRVSFYIQHEFDQHIAEKFSKVPNPPKQEATIQSSMFGENGHLVILVSAACLAAICGLGFIIEALMIMFERKKLSPGSISTLHKREFREPAHSPASEEGKQYVSLTCNDQPI